MSTKIAGRICKKQDIRESLGELSVKNEPDARGRHAAALLTEMKYNAARGEMLRHPVLQMIRTQKQAPRECPLWQMVLGRWSDWARQRRKAR